MRGPLAQRVAQAFAAQGVVSQSVAAYLPREGQLCMAEAVAQTLEDGGVLVAEAGTGIGKTYAYLVPALLSGQRVLISTATKALQDQLFGRDIPRLVQTLGLALRMAMLKGRSSYVCLHRLGQARSDPNLGDDRTVQQLARVEHWALTTTTGDLAELPTLEDNAPLIPWITSTRDNCLGARCPSAQQCHVNLARRQAMAADLVVINHHLFFADLHVRESGVAELLPSVHAVVFDESHQLNEIGVQFLGQQFSTGQVASLSRDIARVATEHARGFAPWALLSSELERSAQALARWWGDQGLAGKQDWAVWERTHSMAAQWHAAVARLAQSLADCQAALQLVAEAHPELQVLHQRAVALLALLERFGQAAAPGCVRWLEAGQQLRMVESPLDIAQAMQQRVLGGGAEPGRGKSWIFTSATLGHDAELSWFVQRCGLFGARVLRVASPFDYATQAHLYVPENFPAAGDSSHSAAVAQLALQGAQVLGGRTLVLTTTLRAMRDIAHTLRQRLDGASALRVLVQGELPKRELLAQFDHANARHILVASASFWEGIDIAGDALQLLIIDKLPFAPPDDPLQQARSRQCEAEGKNAFKVLHLPHAAVALKQGAGRLIRRESDRGILVVADSRLARMGYGRALLKALPPMARLENAQAFHAALQQLTKPSTTGLS